MRFRLADKITVLKEEIMRCLFHRGRMLLIDDVMITDQGMALGEFTVNEGNCDGHEPIPGMLVFRGVDMLEVALQLMGVVMAKNSQLVGQLSGRAFMVKEIGRVRFRGVVKPGDKLVFETVADIEVNDLRGILKIESGRMVGKVGNEIKCEIDSLIIVGIKIDNLRPNT